VRPGRLLAAAVGIGVLAFVVTRAPLGEIAGALKTMGFGVMLTPLVAMLWFAANTSGTYTLFGGRVSWRVLFKNRLMGDGYNALLPLAGVGGEPVKMVHLSAYVASNEAVAVVVIDRAINIISGLLVSAALLLVSLVLYSWPVGAASSVTVYVVVSAAVAIILSWVALSRVPHRFGTWLLARLGKPTTDASPSALPRLILAVEISLLLFLLQIDFDLPAVMAITGLLTAAGVLGFIIPQSLGVAEAGAVFAFHLVGYATVPAVAFGLVRRGRALIVGVAGVLVHLASGKRRSDAPASASSS
jgi:hypothetical protein